MRFLFCVRSLIILLVILACPALTGCADKDGPDRASDPAVEACLNYARVTSHGLAEIKLVGSSSIDNIFYAPNNRLVTVELEARNNLGQHVHRKRLCRFPLVHGRPQFDGLWDLEWEMDFLSQARPDLVHDPRAGLKVTGEMVRAVDSGKDIGEFVRAYPRR